MIFYMLIKLNTALFRTYPAELHTVSIGSW